MKVGGLKGKNLYDKNITYDMVEKVVLDISKCFEVRKLM